MSCPLLSSLRITKSLYTEQMCFLRGTKTISDANVWAVGYSLPPVGLKYIEKFHGVRPLLSLRDTELPTIEVEGMRTIFLILLPPFNTST
jgi:hypothetical protein